MQSTSKVFFPHLDGLRFVAFFVVFLHHVILPQAVDPTRSSDLFHFLNAQKQNGALGVNLFFVLSGFLITYLLLHEKTLQQRVNIPNFYLRRVLRIWPLYFLVVLVGFLVVPVLKASIGQPIVESATLPYYLFFASNFELMEKGLAASSMLNVLWSVGIEEQFYLVWPIIIAVVPLRWLPAVFVAMIGFSIGFRASQSGSYFTLYFHSFAVMGDLVLGALAAWLAYRKSGFVQWFARLSRSTIVTVYVIGFTLILFDYLLFTEPWGKVLYRPIFSLFFAFIILEQNFAQRSFYKMANFRWMTRWGNYTYGLYCLHTAGVLASHILSEQILHVSNPWILMAFDFTFGLALALAAAWLSYHYLEAPFLKWKKKFAFVVRD